MKNTGKILSALVAGAVLTTPAFAVPITFDLAGTVSQRAVVTNGEQWDDPDAVGMQWSAQFVIETDLFGPRQPGGTQYSNMAGFAGLPGVVTPSLTIGGQSIDVARFNTDTFRIDAADSRGIVYEPDGVNFGVAADQWMLNFRSRELVPQGTLAQIYFQLGFYDYFDFETRSGGMDMFAIEDITSPESLLSLPLNGPRWFRDLEYSVENWSCDQTCQYLGSDNWYMDIGSITRTVGTSVAVPEPATFALMLTGLAGALGLRRRRAA